MTRKRSRGARPSEFAYVDSHGDGHLRVADAADVRKAIARFDETEFEGTVARERARLRILVEAEQRHVPIPPDDSIQRPTPGTGPDPTHTPDPADAPDGTPETHPAARPHATSSARRRARAGRQG